MKKQQRTLTKRQKDILDYLKSCVQDEHCPPTVRQICTHFGFASPKAAQDHLDALERKGYIERGDSVSRNIRLTKVPQNGIPVVGRVAAGSPILAEENIDSSIDFTQMFGRSDVFAVQVQGESMKNCGIMDGDLVVVKKDAPVAEGGIGVAYVDGDATVKRIQKTASGYVLEPENEAFEPIQITQETVGFSLAGPVIGVVRKVRTP